MSRRSLINPMALLADLNTSLGNRGLTLKLVHSKMLNLYIWHPERKLLSCYVLDVIFFLHTKIYKSDITKSNYCRLVIF